VSNEKRFVLLLVIFLAWTMTINSFIARKKPVPPPAAEKGQEQDKPPGPQVVVAEKTDAGKDDKKAKLEQGKPEKKDEAKASVAAAPASSRVELLKPSELTLGSITDKSADGYRLEVQLDQKGAGIYSVYSSRYDAEPDENVPRGQAVKRPLRLVGYDPHWPPSLALTLSQGKGAAAADGPDGEPPDNALLRKAAADAEDTLDSVLWDVVRDEKGQTVRGVSGIDRLTKAAMTGQAVVFKTEAKNGVIVTKTFRLFPNTDGLEVDLKFESPDKERSFAYNLLGPYGIPIEGEWYTGTFRDVVFGQLNGQKIDILTNSASDVAAATGEPIDNTTLPLAFAGVENQYFAVLVEPDPRPTGDQDRRDAKTIALLLEKNEKAAQKSDVGVRITSKPIKVGPNQPVGHSYRVFAGPKTVDALKAYDADGLAIYRKNQWIPLAPQIAQFVIAPILRFTHRVTERIGQFFGWKNGNYGIAIILLTLLVRGLMFPIGRKQALAAQKMQQLQPHLKELQDKFKDDKERLTKETFALYKKHGVNPVAGCLPALIQLPIFVGLWQALNTSFPLRQAPFLWIRDLAAPDMLFRMPFEMPFVGHWFNVLPFVVVSLMLVQTKLFAPPATTPEAEMQQKMMKYMMIFMGFMFYKVPSGLGLYFITSSLWAIGERLLLPKITHATPVLESGGASSEPGDDNGGGKGSGGGFHPFGWGKGNGDSDGNGAKVKPPGRFAQFMERVLDEARKDPTYRKVVDERDGKSSDGKERERDRDRPRPKPRKR
jgi:YidC/Oxa1 family membrane protein insertase